jgi:hypothetical protein
VQVVCPACRARRMASTLSLSGDVSAPRNGCCCGGKVVTGVVDQQPLPLQYAFHCLVGLPMPTSAVAGAADEDW